MPLKTLAPVARSREEIRAWIQERRGEGHTIGFVPTMGALHDGHLSLVQTALEHADLAVVSIFVNPTQFAPGEDYDTYPRAETSDLKQLKTAGAALAYCPGVEDMYPPGDSTRVRVEGLSSVLDGAFRPHFFEGVATIVSRLFAHVSPDIAVFGEKDYQQLRIIQRMTEDFGLPVKVIGAPTVREADGLAMSSRNAYLTDEERARASIFAQALTRAVSEIESGARVADARDRAELAIIDAGFGSVDYVSACNADTLVEWEDGPAPAGEAGRLLAAARIGDTRLIDNFPILRPADD